MKNRFSTLQEVDITALSANTRYNNVVKACKEAATNVIPLKPKLKKRLPWETLYICQKREILHQTAELKNSDPTQRNIKNFIRVQNPLTNTYEREQEEYVTRNIEEIQTAISFKKSALAWKTFNEFSGRKKSTKAKLKDTGEKEHIHIWHDHFKETNTNPNI